MELLVDKLTGLTLSLIGFLGSVIIWLHKRSDKKHDISDQKIDRIAKDLVTYKESQARELEAYRSRTATEMSRLEARLEGVTVALEYMNRNISAVSNNVNDMQKTLNDFIKEIRK